MENRPVMIKTKNHHAIINMDNVTTIVNKTVFLSEKKSTITNLYVNTLGTPYKIEFNSPNEAESVLDMIYQEATTPTPNQTFDASELEVLKEAIQLLTVEYNSKKKSLAPISKLINKLEKAGMLK